MVILGIGRSILIELAVHHIGRLIGQLVAIRVGLLVLLGLAEDVVCGWFWGESIVVLLILLRVGVIGKWIGLILWLVIIIEHVVSGWLVLALGEDVVGGGAVVGLGEDILGLCHIADSNIVQLLEGE